jgi:MFS transporter, DHA2 family, methylenomycin A resistance protein
VASGTGELVLARVVQGVGAALLLPGTLAIITRAYPDAREQARAIGVWAGIGSAALPAGPLLGGALVDWVGLRSVFLLNVPIVVVAFAVASRAARESTDTGGRRLDLAGTLLGALLLAAVTFAFIEAGHDGIGPAVAAAALVAVGLLVVFIAVERSRPDPTLPLFLFRRPAFSLANATAGAMNLGTLGMLFLLTLYLQGVRDLSPLEAGVAALPLFLPLALLAPVAGRATARVGPTGPMVAGLLVSAAGLALLLRLDPESGYSVLLPALALWGLGLAALTPAVVAAAMAAVPADRAALASAVNNTARQAGGAIGIAAFGAIAGSPADGHSFVRGMLAAALVAAAMYVAAAVASVALGGLGTERG